MSELEALQGRLGYRFEDAGLLRQALTHRSYGARHNERLEYLGDSVLGLVMTEALYARFPQAVEGELSRMRAQLVCRETLAAEAREVGLQGCLLLGRGEVKSGGRERDAVLGDALEAVIGAVYLDGDLAAVRGVVLRRFARRLKGISPDVPKDAKTRLQEWMQQRGLPVPQYRVVGQEGAQHAMTFKVACEVVGVAEAVTASGKNRREGERNVARKVLALLDGGEE